jgi:dTDP-4-dehydrorhamnose 3,5-epimerase
VSIALTPSAVPGAVLLEAPVFRDARGSFTKPFSRDLVAAAGVDFTPVEVYWSASHPGVIRGLHLQLPPTPVAKIAFVTSGVVRDVVLDLRRGSPTERRCAVFELRPGSGAVVVPVGCAHGFEVIEGPATFCSIQSGPFDAAAEVGVRWDSAGVPWRTPAPIVSDKDAALPPLGAFVSPFVFEGPA